MKLTAGGLAVLVLALAPSAQAATRPDLRVRALTPASATAAPGATLTFSPTVSNAGRARAGRSVVRVLRSTDAKRDKRDTVLAQRQCPRARPRQALPAHPSRQASRDHGRHQRADLRGRPRQGARDARDEQLPRRPRDPGGDPELPRSRSGPAQSIPVAPSTPAANGCAATDAPDLQHVDSDCDGIDGTAATSIFVSVTGDDANPGTKAAPKRTVVAGIAEAVKSARTAVLISGGQFPGRPMIVNGISLYGAL